MPDSVSKWTIAIKAIRMPANMIGVVGSRRGRRSTRGRFSSQAIDPARIAPPANAAIVIVHSIVSDMCGGMVVMSTVHDNGSVDKIVRCNYVSRRFWQP